jgi:N-acyl homoserine lactone hydrolase
MNIRFEPYIGRKQDIFRPGQRRPAEPAGKVNDHLARKEQVMKIHALSTGTVQIKTAMARGRGRGPARFAHTLLDRHYTEDLPIHAWLIEHDQGPILVDTGDLASTRNVPIARFSITREQEIDRQLADRGLRPQDLRLIVLTHLDGDHINGLARLPGVKTAASADALSRGGSRKLSRRGITPTPLALEDEPFGAFERSAALTDDRSVVAVPVPGHARGQIAVVVVEDDCQVLIAGDTAYTEQQLIDQHVDGVSRAPGAAIRSMRTVLEHAGVHPTVFLPSHDPAAAARLSDRKVLATA